MKLHRLHNVKNKLLSLQTIRNVMPLKSGGIFNLKKNNMEIFDKQIFGEDKEFWLAQSVEWKVEWIRKYTSQQNDAIIEEFVNNPKISKDKICLTCGDKFKEIIKEETVNATADIPIKVTLKKTKK